MDKLRVWRKPHNEIECEIFRGVQKDKKFTYLLCIDPFKRDLFIATYRLGAWMELDVNEIYYILTSKD